MDYKKAGGWGLMGMALYLCALNVADAWANITAWQGAISVFTPAFIAATFKLVGPAIMAGLGGAMLPQVGPPPMGVVDRRQGPRDVPPAVVGAVLLLVFCAAPVFAQSAAITSHTLQVYNPGVNPATGMPFQTNVIPAASVTCNQTKPTVPPNVVNPTQIFWDDTANAGKACIVDQSAFLLALPVPNPFGQYVATVIATNAGGNSPRSAASNPFSRILAPPAQTGLSVF